MIWKFSLAFPSPLKFIQFIIIFGIVFVTQFRNYVCALFQMYVNITFIKFLTAKRSFNWIYHVKCPIRCLSAWDMCEICVCEISIGVFKESNWQRPWSNIFNANEMISDIPKTKLYGQSIWTYFNQRLENLTLTTPTIVEIFA